VTLRARSTIIFALAVGGLIVILTAAVDRILAREFGDLERREALHRAAQASRALAQEVEALDTLVSDYAAWDDTYKYMRQPSPGFIESGMPSDSRLRLSLALLVDEQGTIVWGRGYERDSDRVLPVPAVWRDHIASIPPFVRHVTAESRHAGVFTLGQQAWVVASRPITTSQRRGPVRGSVVMARALDGAEIERLSRTTALDLQLETMPSPQSADGADVTLDVLSANRLVARVPITDVNGRPAVQLAVSLTREINRQRWNAQITLLVALIVGALGFAAVTLRTTERHIVRRIVAIAGFVRSVKAQHDLARRVDDTGRDEIGEVASALNDLLGTLDERTRDLETARLEALQASKLKSEFVANMSHEIRTPMNGVLGMTSILMDTPLNGEQREIAETAHRSAEALLHILNDILDFSKIEAGQLMIEAVPFEIEPIVFDAAQLAMPAAEKKGLDLVVRVAPDVPRLLVGDGGRLRQILLNLVSNAVKFTSAGHVRVTVDGHAEGETWRLRCAVEDTGIGISPDQLSKVFEQFVQADSSMTRRYGGTGLGLTISRQLASLMGGTLSATSHTGAGSTFSLEVPLPIDYSEAHTRVGADFPEVLLVDRPALRRSVWHDVLSSRGVRTHVCDDVAGVNGVVRAPNVASRVLVFTQLPTSDDLAALDAAGCGDCGLVVLGALGNPKLDAIRDRVVAIRALPRPSALLDAIAVAHAQVLGPRDVTRPRPAPSVDGGGLRVLVVEDNEINQRVARRLLEKCGCEVELSADGRAGVEAVTSGTFDLVLMDCQMPEMDGYEATIEIRRMGKPYSDLPIVALTASALPDERARCLDVGMNDCLTKPLRPADLERLIRDLVARRTAA
jgi:signal transduction histidine kinase/CheY-like chemotaxis protein